MRSEVRERVRIPHGFYAGPCGRKIHLGVERRGDVVRLACGMSGVAFGAGPFWLYPAGEEVNCARCKRSAA